MDQESLERWKQEFQAERKEQYVKIKEIQKETMQRRKAMEMRAQLEAAKEEKRRKDALAERKANHIEATMRFQKGIKHFKINKEKVSIEDVMKKISHPSSSSNRNRINSADDKVIVYNNELANYYCVSKQHQHNINNNTNSYAQHQSNNNKLKKSLSFDNLNSFPKYSNSSNGSSSSSSKSQKNFNMIEHYNKSNHYFSSNNNHNSNIDESHLNGANNNPNKASNFKDVLYENQRTIQEINKEALKEFQSLITNEIKKEDANRAQKQISNSSAISTVTYKDPKANNNLYIEESNTAIKINNKTQNNKIKDYELGSDIATVISIDDSSSNNSDNENSDDTMDTDSLINAKIEPPEPLKLNKVDAQTDFSSGDYKSNFTSTHNNSDSLLNYFNRNTFNTPQNQSSSTLDSTYSFLNNFKTYNLTKETKSIPFKKNSYQASNFNGIYDNKSTNSETNILNNVSSNSGSVINKPKSSAGSQTIKSILKRSSSLDNSLSIIGLTNNTVNFGIKGDKSSVKDSIEVINNRINSARKKDSLNENEKKKTVRFAAALFQESDAQSRVTFNQDHSENNLSDKNLNDQNQSSQKQPSSANHNSSSNLMYSRISSTNSIRRPIVKPRSNAIKSKTESIHEGVNGNHTGEAVISTGDKPPVYPTYTVNGGIVSSGYSAYNQKRREITQRARSVGATPDRINSPKGVSLRIDLSPNVALQQHLQNTYSAPNQETEHYLNGQLSNQQIKHSQNTPQSTDTIPATNTHQIPPTFTNNHDHNSSIYDYKKDNSFHEYQPLRTKTDLIINNQTTPAPNTNITVLNNNTNKFKLYYTDFNISNHNNNINIQTNQLQPNTSNANSNTNTSTNNNNTSNQVVEQFSLSRIPLSPKSNLKANYYYFNPSDKLSTNINGIEQIVLRRPFSAQNTSNPSSINPSVKVIPSSPSMGHNTVPMSTPTSANHTPDNNQNNNNNISNKTNIRFAYLNNSISNQLQMISGNGPNGYILPIQTGAPVIVPRVSSADNISRNVRPVQQNGPNNSNTPYHLEIKYPLYSNYQAQNQPPTQFINITKPIKPIQLHEYSNGEIADSMAVFLKAEEMSTKDCTESQILNAVQDIQNKPTNPQIKNPPDTITLSMEEQNVKNSILKLNQRLNYFQRKIQGRH